MTRSSFQTAFILKLEPTSGTSKNLKKGSVRRRKEGEKAPSRKEGEAEAEEAGRKKRELKADRWRRKENEDQREGLSLKFMINKEENRRENIKEKLIILK